MKSVSAVLFASVAAAADLYGAAPSAYTTIDPGYGHALVTVTSQYQPIPTYVAGKKHGYFSKYKYVSTVIDDAEGKCTITRTKQPVTVYHHKTTYTRTTTYNVPGYPVPTGGYKNCTTKVWHELYEKVYEVPYKQLGPSALPGYGGSGLCEKACHGDGDTIYQPVHVKEYTGGKWNMYKHTLTYGLPKPSTTMFPTPGVYTLSAYDVTVDHATTIAGEATATCNAGKTVTYGGYTTSFAYPTTVTVPYGAYEKDGDKTKTIIKYITVTATGAGKYTVIQPTTTVYEYDTTIAYPTAVCYETGVYHHPRETVTIINPNKPYVCTAYSPKHTNYPGYKSPPSGTRPYPADPSSDYEEPAESYGHVNARAYFRRGGVLRRSAPEVKRTKGKRVIVV
ncbi:hypothetical protein P154DRAFT_588528 [Amniculicola lignicola CBS 123094]|uniref:Lytic polysaccharide monooxygenase n=1 Tax=Amniculicola lignicola CBS 123094 TaxID=1392246 RepID=A0A6A5WUQ2_9PLEO|nr:hypothetical protein P154DRAFT_588528 [Amniculicola lignicola CBS 123094]